MSEENKTMLWRGAAHYANGMLIGLSDYINTQEVPERVKNHIEYLKSRMQKEIDKAVASTEPPTIPR